MHCGQLKQHSCYNSWRTSNRLNCHNLSQNMNNNNLKPTNNEEQPAKEEFESMLILQNLFVGDVACFKSSKITMMEMMRNVNKCTNLKCRDSRSPI